MTNEEAKNVLLNAAWLGTDKERERIEKAVSLAVKVLTPASGFWIYDSYYGGIYKCSICGHWQGMKSDFCPECGASMKAG